MGQRVKTYNLVSNHFRGDLRGFRGKKKVAAELLTLFDGSFVVPLFVGQSLLYTSSKLKNCCVGKADLRLVRILLCEPPSEISDIAF